MKLIKERAFYISVLSIALPIALQNLISFGVNMTDTLMMGVLGEVQMSAVSLASQPFFIFSVLTFGISSGISVLTSQYWGKADILPIRRTFAIALNAATFLSLIFFIGTFFFPRQIMSIYSDEATIIELGAQYLKIISFAYLLYGFTNTYLCILRSVEAVKIPLLVYGISFFIDASVNYILVFGKLGLPAMGVRGAAIGTVIARAAELLMVLVYMYRFEKKVQLRISDLFKIDLVLLGDYLRHGLPVLLNELLWSVGMSAQAMIIGRIGSDFVAANSIVSVVQQFTTIAVFGMANAGAVVIGKAVGTGKNEYVRRCANTLYLLSMGIGVLGAMGMLLLRRVAVNFYNVPVQTKEIANTLLLVAAVNLFFVSICSINLIGTLRGSGDTRFVFVADTIMIWVLSVPLGMLTGWVLQWPPWAVFICLRVDEPLKALAVSLRLKGNKWINNVTR